jgi:23S rRNA (uridine2552-2'-O)-methyltransferase
MELDRKDQLLGRGMRVVDLGAAPGSWSQYAQERVAPEGKVFALDILDMEPIPGVTFIKGDFREQDILDALLAAMGSSRVDVVMSDMAPNISGIAAADQSRSVYLVELTFDLAGQVLVPGGTLVTKVFQGEGFDAFVKTVRGVYHAVHVRKPKASRPRSREVYVIAKGYSV